MSGPLVKSPAVMVDPIVRPRNRQNVYLRAFAPLLAVGLALLAHLLMPNRQMSPPTRFYPGLLGVLMILAVALIVMELLGGRARRWAREHGPLLQGAAIVLALWDFVTLKMAWMPLPYFPGPDRILAAMWEDHDVLGESTFSSLQLLLCGYAVGVAAGVVSGILIGWFRSVRYWGMPILKLVGPIPATAYMPLVMVMFNTEFHASVALIAMAVWFPVTMLTTSGIANVPKSYLDVAKTLGAGPGYLIFRVALPAAMPSIFLGLFMGLGAAFLTLIVAETLGVSSGLGWYLKWKQGYLEYAHVYGALVIMSIFFSGLMTILFKVRDRVLGWQKGVLQW